MKKGKLIVIEGACDGIGKTTQYNLLFEHLQNDGYEVSKHHFPSYETYQGKPVEKYLKGEYGKPDKLSPYFINSLYANDRSITWYTKLKPLFDKGNIILLDRYTTSSLIYQSALIEDFEERKKFINFVTEFEYSKLGIKSPDKVIFLYAPFNVITQKRIERNSKEGSCGDIHENNIDFMKKVYDNALFVADYLGWDKIECNIGNKLKSIEDIHNEIYQHIV